MRRFYVYIYHDPRDGAPFYVGKGQGYRSAKHLHQCHSRPLASKIQQLRGAGLLPDVRILHCESEQEAYDLEASFIDLYGRRVDGGILFNVLPAGERTTGFAGHHHTAEARARISAALRVREITDEHRAKLSAAGKARNAAACLHTQEAKAKIAAYRASPEGRAKIAEAARKSLTPEHQARMTEAARAVTVGKPKSAEHRAKIGAAQKGRSPSPESRARMSAAQKRRYAK